MSVKWINVILICDGDTIVLLWQSSELWIFSDETRAILKVYIFCLHAYGAIQNQIVISSSHVPVIIHTLLSLKN